MAVRVGEVKTSNMLDDDMFKMQDEKKFWINQKSIMIGVGKSGKTTFWAQYPEKTFFIKTESGHNHIKHIGYECRCWKDVEKVKGKLVALAKSNDFPFETIVIDTGDRLLDLMNEEVVARGVSKFPKNEINGIGDIPNGTGWFWRTAILNEFIKDIEALPAHIVFIFHVGTEECEDAFGVKYKKDTISVGGKSGKSLLFWADNNMHLIQRVVGEKTIREIALKGTKHLEAGTRVKGVPDKMTWGDDMKANFDNFRKLFD